MKKKQMRVMSTIVCACLLLTGCGDAMPDMTQEQQGMIAEYAASMLLKYCSYYDNGIVPVEEALAEPETQEDETSEPESETEVTEEADEADVAEQKTETAETAEETETQQESQGNQIAIGELAGILGLDEDIQMQFDSCEITKSYPTGDANAYFSVDAPEGKELLIVRFNVANQGDDEAACELYAASAQFMIDAGGGGYKSILSTSLLDDLSTFSGTISAGETQSLVLLVEVNEGTVSEDSALTLQVSANGSVNRIKLTE